MKIYVNKDYLLIIEKLMSNPSCDVDDSKPL